MTAALDERKERALADWKLISGHKEAIAEILTAAALVAIQERGGYVNETFREELHLLIKRAL